MMIIDNDVDIVPAVIVFFFFFLINFDWKCNLLFRIEISFSTCSKLYIIHEAKNTFYRVRDIVQLSAVKMYKAKSINAVLCYENRTPVLCDTARDKPGI